MSTISQKIFLIIFWISIQYFALNAQVLNLDSLYISKPSDAERDEIISSFNITLKDGDEVQAKWSLYDPYYFNPNSTNPTIYSLINSLRVIREQKFSEPLPFTNNAYQYMLSHFKLGGIELSLQTGYNSGGNNHLYLNANAAFWDGRSSTDPFTPSQYFRMFPYIYKIQLLLHESRHSDPDDPGHDPNIAGKDTRFDFEGAYARDALYYMWVYKYGINNNSTFRKTAVNSAMYTLMNRFVEMPPTHSNPKIQQLIDEIIPKIKIQDGNNQIADIGSNLPKLLQVNVYNPLLENEIWDSSINIQFRVITVPKGAKGYSLSSVNSTTNSGEPAAVSFKLGDKAGIYLVSANAPTLGKDSVVFTFTTKEVPIANAGTDQSVNEGSVVTLNGSGSFDLNGNSLLFKWT